MFKPLTLLAKGAESQQLLPFAAVFTKEHADKNIRLSTGVLQLLLYTCC